MDKGKSFTPQPNASASASAILTSSVSIIALAHIHEPRQAANGPEVKVVEAVFAAGQRQHYGVGGCLLDKLSIVVPSGGGTVTAADQEKVSVAPLFTASIT